MPALSKKQQKFMGIVRSIQKGEQPAGKFSKDAQDAAKDMKKSSVKKYAATKHKGKPEKVKSEATERDYKEEYKKFQSSTKAKKYRAELNKYNRQKGTYGNGDGKDASHKGGKIVGFESESKNRGRAEKSRLKKEQIVGRLKEMIKQELSEYTYGTGDAVKDVNPTCPHYGAEGKVKSVNPRSVVFVVTNKGDNFKPGQELEKSHDQMKKIGESAIQEQTVTPINKIKDIKNLVKKDLVSYRGTGAGGNFEISIRNKKVPGYPPSFALLQKDEKKYRDIRSKQFKIKPVAKYFIKGSDLNQLKKFGHVGFLATNRRESVNEMSDKSKKIINKLGKKEKEMFIDMVDMLGFDQVMADYKRDKKAFKQALKDMSENIIKEEGNEVQTGKEYTKLWLQAIEMIIKQANGLKGPLAKHPIKRDINKLKAVKKLFAKFIKPAVESQGSNNSHYAPDISRLKKYLQDGKFKAAIQYVLRDTLQSGNFRQNSWYYLDDKEKNLIKKMDKVLYDIETKMDKANLENVNESMNPSAIKKMRDEFEKTGDLPPHLKKFVLDLKILKKKHKVKNIVVPGLEWMSDMKEQSVPGNFDKALGKLKFNQFTPTNVKRISKRFKVDYKDAVEWIKLNHVINVADKPTMAESINEDGHTDVASAKRKAMLMVEYSNKLLNKLNGMNKEDSLPSWLSDKITLASDYLHKATHYLLNPVESVNEEEEEIPADVKKIAKELDKAVKMHQSQAKRLRKAGLSEFRDKREADIARDQIGNKALYMIGAKDFVFGNSGGKKSLVFKIMRNSKGVSHIRMRLSSMDLYDMEFLAIRAGKIKVKSKEKGVYGDQLGVMIKKNTGLNIRL